MLAGIAVALVLQTAAGPGTVPDCTYDRTAQLALAPDAFDEDMDGGWRALADRPGCKSAAADLLAEYRKAHWGALTPGQLHINYWHEGQLRASLGQRDRAVRLLLAGVNPQSPAGFDHYALGTVAFLQNDRQALEAARARLAALPVPSEFADAAARFKTQTGHDITWPLNLDVLDGFIACFGRSYDEAYGDCRPSS